MTCMVDGHITYSMGITNKRIKHEYTMIQIEEKAYRFYNGDWTLLAEEGAAGQHCCERQLDDMVFTTKVDDDSLRSAKRVLREYRKA